MLVELHGNIYRQLRRGDGQTAKIWRSDLNGRGLLDAGPGLTLADEPAHDAAFEFQLVRACQRNEAGIGLAVLGIIDLAFPLAVLAGRLHRLHDLHPEQRPAALCGIRVFRILAGIAKLDQLAAERAATRCDPDF